MILSFAVGLLVGIALAGLLVGIVPLALGFLRPGLGLGSREFFVCAVSGVILGLFLAVPVCGILVWLVVKKPLAEVTSTLKKCPYCAEEIRIEAIVCRHCQRELGNSETILNASFLMKEITSTSAIQA